MQLFRSFLLKSEIFPTLQLRIKCLPLQECHRLHTNRDSWLTVMPTWRSVAPNTCGSLYIMLPSTSATGTRPFPTTLLRSEPRASITMLRFLMLLKNSSDWYLLWRNLAHLISQLTDLRTLIAFSGITRCLYCHAFFYFLNRNFFLTFFHFGAWLLIVSLAK